ncbi:MAG: response regulator, partial [bacterium]
LLGGDIFIDSEEGKGSVFRFTIPNEQVETTFYEPVIQTTIDKELNWSEKTILVAEDEEYNFLLINEVVKKTGVKIVWAKDGLEAVELFGKQHVDLVLMDIKMPNMDGFEATVKIKEMNSKVPVIAQTAFAMTDEKEKSFEAGCDGYLAKPIKPRELLITISQFF